MKAFGDRVARVQVLWLFGHAVALTVIEVIVFLATLEDHSRVLDHVGPVKYWFGMAATVAGALAGVAIAVVCVRRLLRPFPDLKMQIDMRFWLAVEFIFIFLSGFILDLGQTQFDVVRLSLAINLGLLAFVPGARPMQ